MGRPLNVTFSNLVERLYEELKVNLFSKETDPFTKRYLVVPSPAMKTWLMTRMASDKELRVAAGVNITSLDLGVREWILSLSVNTEFPKKMSELELSLILEVEIKKIAANYFKMPLQEKTLWHPLLSYVFGRDDISENLALKKREQRKILALATRLANLFPTYSKYGRRMLKKWKENPAEEWQSALWKLTVNQVFPEKCEWKGGNIAIHLFGMSFISQLEHELLLSLAKIVPVDYYLLSPCHMFWSDILSDRECKNLIRYWEGKNVPESNREALAELLYDKNSLLANLAKVGREMARQIECSNVCTKETYEIQNSLLEIDSYTEFASCDLAISESLEQSTLLKALQGDLLLMRNPTICEKINFAEDASIQLLAACTPMREVQAVYDTILSIIEESLSKEKIYPEDVIVMAPDIIGYEPFIKAVFSQNDAGLDYQMSDLNVSLRQPEIHGLLQLFKLANSRWEVSSVFQLFENPSFQAKHRFTQDDVLKIETWIRSADVRWGKDPLHRREVLERDLEESCRIDTSPSGTWKQAIDRLLLGMAMCVPEGNDAKNLDSIPLEIIETSQAPLFGKWVRIMRSLSLDLEILADGTQMTLKEWSLYINCLIESYLEMDGNEEAVRRVLNLLDGISNNLELQSQTFPFLTIQYHLEAHLLNERSEYRESNLHAVRFCSMLPMRALPAKVVILMGMNEGNYPRIDGSDALNLLKNEKEKDYCPTKADFDRYLFLETILSARRYYILSYCTHSKEDGKELSPSLLISELLGYLDGGYTIQGDSVSKKIRKLYPFNPYDKKLFEKDSKAKSFSEMYYKASLAYYQKRDESPKHSFFSNFSLPSISSSKQIASIELKNLVRLAKNPIETYFKETLGIYLNDEEDSLSNDEENFVISNLERHFINKSVIRGSLEHTLEFAEKKGILPVGPFKDYSIGVAAKDAKELIKNMNLSNVFSTQIFSIKFNETNTTPFRSDNGDWHLPPLVCYHEGIQIKIVGELSDMSHSGMLSIKNAKSAEFVRNWPQYLVFACLLKQHALSIDGNLLFLKDGEKKVPFFDDPFPLLEHFIRYYFYSLENPSPLIPEWIPEIIKNDPKKFQVKIRQTLEERNQYFFNNCLKWSSRDSKLPDHEIILKDWNEMAKLIFGEMLHHWDEKAKTKLQDEDPE